MYVGKTDINFYLIRPIIVNLIHQAHITPPANIIDDLIKMASQIAILDQPKDARDKLIDGLDVISFNALQRQNEMSLEPLNDDQMADITKIHMASLIALIEVISASKL